jgi:hypothetical protein
MSWTDVDLIHISTEVEPLPEQTFHFKLVGAKQNPFDPNKIDFTAEVTDGEFARRKAFGSYPDPVKQPWAPKALKRLVDALKVPMEEGETHDPIAYLNRAASVGATFTSAIKNRTYTNATTGEAKTKSEVDIAKVS